MCFLSDSLVHLGVPYSRWKRVSATQHPAEEAVTEVSKEDKEHLGSQGNKVAWSRRREHAREQL